MGQQDRAVPSDAELDAMQWVADPHADRAIEAIVGPSPTPAERVRRIGELNGALDTWDTNGGVANWRPSAQTPAYIAEPLSVYVTVARELPEWADKVRIGKGERLFMDYGALSVTTLFCASLPECYVVPDLATVLQATGQLVHRVDHRIRATGAMVFPAMMRGGLTDPDASGIAQILKVRLIHAAIRNLLLRDSPQVALLRLGARGVVLPLESAPAGAPRHQAFLVHGWDLSWGLPNNQEELAYTLLTFGFVFLRGMRRLGIPIEAKDEEGYIHVWNVAGHFLGIDPALMVDTMEDAQALFARMQARGRADWEKRPAAVDPRPQLGAALMNAMAAAIPNGRFKAFPILLARHLIEPASIRDLKLDGHVSCRSRALFATLMAVARGLDALIRLVSRDFSLCRLITRAIGYRLTCALLMSETRELLVPAQLHPGIHALIARWGTDPKASGWMNALEDRLTTPGDWRKLPPRP